MVEWRYASADLSADLTTIAAVPCLVKGATVTTAMSGQACPIMDATVPVFSLPASSAVGYEQFPGGEGGIRFENSLIVDPDNSATGTITLLYKELGAP